MGWQRLKKGSRSVSVQAPPPVAVVLKLPERLEEAVERCLLVTAQRTSSYRERGSSMTGLQTWLPHNPPHPPATVVAPKDAGDLDTVGAPTALVILGATPTTSVAPSTMGTPAVATHQQSQSTSSKK